MGPAIAPVRKPLASFKRRQNIGAQGRNRTTDTVIFSHVLYQLSYPRLALASICCCFAVCLRQACSAQCWVKISRRLKLVRSIPSTSICCTQPQCFACAGFVIKDRHHVKCYCLSSLRVGLCSRALPESITAAAADLPTARQLIRRSAPPQPMSPDYWSGLSVGAVVSVWEAGGPRAASGARPTSVMNTCSTTESCWGCSGPTGYMPYLQTSPGFTHSVGVRCRGLMIVGYNWPGDPTLSLEVSSGRRASAAARLTPATPSTRYSRGPARRR